MDDSWNKNYFLCLCLLLLLLLLSLHKPLLAALRNQSRQKSFLFSQLARGYRGLNSFFANSGNFTPGTLNKPKTLTQVRYEVAAYPQALTDSVQLCYLQPYQSLPTRCITVPSGSSGTTTQFNDLRFDTGIGLQIRHEVTGHPSNNVRPSRQENVTWDYSY